MSTTCVSGTFVWPDGIQAAATVTVNFAGESVEHSSMSLPLWGRNAHGRYGAQQGVYNLLELFRRYDVTATFFIGGWDAERYPEAMEAIAGAGHEIAGQGYLHEDFSKLSLDEQRAVLERSEAVHQSRLRSQAGRFSRARSPDVARDAWPARRARLSLRSSYCDDDQPYVVNLKVDASPNSRSTSRGSTRRTTRNTASPAS